MHTQKTYRAGVMQNPAVKSLRQLSNPSDNLSNSELGKDDFCRPGSQQSLLSLSKYLHDIYQLAIESITPLDIYRLIDNRRPDLAQIKLSDDNLNCEVTTLSLANNVMLAAAMSAPDASKDEFFALLSEESLPIYSLPYDLAHETVRQGLNSLYEVDLNTLSHSLRGDLYAPGKNYSVVHNEIDVLGLYAGHRQILFEIDIDGLECPVIEDSFICGGIYRDENFGFDTKLSLMNITAELDYAEYGDRSKSVFLKFNTESLLRTIVGESRVMLHIHARSSGYPGSLGKIQVRRVDNSWEESTITCNNAPVILDNSDVSVTKDIIVDVGKMIIDVTELIQEQPAHEMSFRICFLDVNTTSSISFDSLQASSPAYLKVETIA